MDGFCFRIYCENRRGKILSHSKNRVLFISLANPIFSDFSRLFLTTSSERDVLESCAEIEIYVGCSRASVLSSDGDGGGVRLSLEVLGEQPAKSECAFTLCLLP